MFTFNLVTFKTGIVGKTEPNLTSARTLTTCFRSIEFLTRVRWRGGADFLTSPNNVEFLTTTETLEGLLGSGMWVAGNVLG